MAKNTITIKTEDDIKIMAEGGAKLGRIKNELTKAVAEGENAAEVDKLADHLINAAGGKASFKMVPDYDWATCINVNDGVVHGIPKDIIVFKNRDVVSVDVGFYYKGFHTDTSFSVLIGEDKKLNKFLEVGKKALGLAIDKAVSGNRIYDISDTIESTLEENGLKPIEALVGHGIGKNLHEEPQIPCFTIGKYGDSPEIKNGMVFAIEVMYSSGDPDVEQDADGWTISLVDGKIAGLYEETVAITAKGPQVLTAIKAD